MQGDGEKRKRQLLARHAFIRKAQAAIWFCSADDDAILKGHTKTN
ncbi:hypothetical protein N473_19200 [Pseudoalteromonas luteoviolacea CPMOR-1]|uniref:Uncharacterized protein n=1 Tax=Pseudoalteromonas luteoviolacea CPMOR-1 TaxID=1365248 RepID=A0A167KGF7_9GAMM|nr:hypothetical protein N473_19200 [Pseudoalteromonas luteoviolacea CPMOR-1]